METRTVKNIPSSFDSESLLELQDHELKHVAGGELAMNLATSWSSGVAGVAVGAMANGVRGALIGGVVGFALGAAISIGYHLATGGGGKKGGGSLINPA